MILKKLKNLSSLQNLSCTAPKVKSNLTDFPILYLAFEPTVGNKTEKQKIFTKN